RGRRQAPAAVMTGPTLAQAASALAHSAHGGGTAWSVAFPIALGLAVLYVAAVARAPAWPRSRTTSWLGGCAVLAVAGTPLAGSPADARAHVLAHLLVGMVAPIGL